MSQHQRIPVYEDPAVLPDLRVAELWVLIFSMIPLETRAGIETELNRAITARHEYDGKVVDFMMAMESLSYYVASDIAIARAASSFEGLVEMLALHARRDWTIDDIVQTLSDGIAALVRKQYDGEQTDLETLVGLR